VHRCAYRQGIPEYVASADYAKSDRPVARTASDVQNSNPSVAIRGTRSSFIRLATSLKRASVFR
jgi:hypothetical protein